MKEINPQQKESTQNCGESCGCKEKPASEIPQQKESKQPKPNPTRFGDWEVKGRAIDF